MIHATVGNFGGVGRRTNREGLWASGPVPTDIEGNTPPAGAPVCVLPPRTFPGAIFAAPSSNRSLDGGTVGDAHIDGDTDAGRSTMVRLPLAGTAARSQWTTALTGPAPPHPLGATAQPAPPHRQAPPGTAALAATCVRYTVAFPDDQRIAMLCFAVIHPSRTPVSLSPLDTLAATAGFIDADGCILLPIP